MVYIALYGDIGPKETYVSALVKAPEEFRKYTLNNRMNYEFDPKTKKVRGFERFIDSVFAIDKELNNVSWVDGDSSYLSSCETSTDEAGKYLFCEDYTVLSYSGDDDNLAKLEYLIL